MSGVCGLSVLETHRISRATRTANVMSLFVFCESRGGRRTTLSPIIDWYKYLGVYATVPVALLVRLSKCRIPGEQLHFLAIGVDMGGSSSGMSTEAGAAGDDVTPRTPTTASSDANISARSV